MPAVKTGDLVVPYSTWKENCVARVGVVVDAPSEGYQRGARYANRQRLLVLWFPGEYFWHEMEEWLVVIQPPGWDDE